MKPYEITPKSDKEENTTNTTAGATEQEAGDQEEDNLIDFQAAVARGREAHIEATLAVLQRYTNKFEQSHQALSEAAQTFRNKTSPTFRQVRAVTTALQELRKLAGICLDFIESGEALIPPLPSCSSISLPFDLQHVDGEKTARLILEMDLFESMVSKSSYDERLTHARERINMHVSLQSDLREETKRVQKLIHTMKNVIEEAKNRPPTPTDTHTFPGPGLLHNPPRP